MCRGRQRREGGRPSQLRNLPVNLDPTQVENSLRDARHRGHATHPILIAAAAGELQDSIPHQIMATQFFLNQFFADGAEHQAQRKDRARQR